MYQYRKTLYNKYYQTQSGRRSEREINDKLKQDSWHFQQEIIPLLPKVVSQPNIIDIGCGFGSLVHALQQQGYQKVRGIDLSPDQVAEAEKIGIKGVEQADLIEYLKKHPNTFDVIIGIDIIEHFSKDELVEILEIIQLGLCSKGIAVFRTPNADALFSSLYMFGDFTHETILNNSSAEQLFHSTGFSKVTVTGSCMKIKNPIKEFLRIILWKLTKVFSKTFIFASGRSSKGLIFSPNIIISAQKK